MRRFVLFVLILAGTLAGTGPGVGAQELPPGFTDGVPAGSGEAQLSASGSAAVAASTTRYFGQGPWDAVRAAATATSRSCSISDDGLTALVLSPVFKESSAATTASSTPAPMTLSRYDEWTGTMSTSGPMANSNYGLYAYRDPNTAYQRAFWSPGIGIWQYDSAGLGAPLTTIEAMDVRAVSGDVARVMATKYCAAAAGSTDQQRRYAAWSDWGNPCTLCEGFFQEMTSTTPKFANLSLVAGIDRLGGVVQRSCSIPEIAHAVACWYVNPSVGTIQGSTAWATFSPDGGTSNTSPPTPLPRPFYVVDRGTTEERHWLRADTGYGIDIKASRTIGTNARPRATQAGSGLAWSTSGLCDLTTGRGQCVPLPPAGMSSTSYAVGSGARPVTLDANGDGRDDILWYRAGSGTDRLWLGSGGGGFSPSTVTISSAYDQVVAADVDGDGDEDLVFYAKASGTSFLWRSDGDGTFKSTPLTPGSGKVLLTLDADGGTDTELFWYAPGSGADSLWSWTGSGFGTASRSVSQTYTPLVGDFDGNGRDDIFWYTPGSVTDFVWLHKTSGGYTNLAKPVSGTYRPVIGDLDGDGRDDIVWYGPGSVSDSVWFGALNGAFANRGISVNGTYTPIVARLTAADRDQVLWYAPGSGADWLWTWSDARVSSSVRESLPSKHVATRGDFSAGGYDGLFWYDATALPDVVWYR